MRTVVTANRQPPGPPPAPIYRAAVHESGHAVLALLLGLRVNTVWVVGEAGGGGCEVSESREFDADAFERLAIATWGGNVAEEIVFGQGRPIDNTSDEEDLLELAGIVHPGDPHRQRAFLDRTRAQAMRRVAQYRATIERLAGLLVRRGRLSGDQVQSMLRG